MTRIEQARGRAARQRDTEAVIRHAIDGLLAVAGHRPAEVLRLMIRVASADLAAVDPSLTDRR